MPNSIPSNLPNKYNPGEVPHPGTMNKVMEHAKVSCNSKTTSGIQNQSGSSGNHLSVDERILRPPIWAMITNQSLIIYPPGTIESPPGHTTASGCYGRVQSDGKLLYRYIYHHVFSWVELSEDLDLARIKNPKKDNANALFPIANSYIPSTDKGVFADPCIRIAPIINDGLNYGTLRKNPAFMVNSLLALPGLSYSLYPWYSVPVGSIVQLYYGAGDYMLFEYRVRMNSSPEQNDVIMHDFEQPWLPGIDHP